MKIRYYHYICNDIEKEIYATFLEGLLEYKNEITFSNMQNINIDVFSRVLKMVLYDNPRIFYARTNIVKALKYPTSIAIFIEYVFPLSSIPEIHNWLNEKIGEICSPVYSLNDDFSKEIYIHNYLIEKIKYSKTDVAQPTNAYTVVGALLENFSVCAGIALSFKLLMDFLEIPCIVASGQTTNSGDSHGYHAWNIVSLENNYYQIDVTWDLIEEDDSRLVKYDYFNLTSSEMYKTRIPEYQYPICVSDEFNYFYYMNAIASDTNDIVQFVINAVRSHESNIYIKYTWNTLTKYELKELLKSIPNIGSYVFWFNEKTRTIFIKRDK